MINLDDGNVLLYAIKAYDRRNYVKSEFEEDYKTFRYIKRLLQRYRVNNELRENLILNHINFIRNTFGVDAGTRLLFLKMEKCDWSSLKTFLIYLNLMPEIVHGIRGEDIHSSSISVDLHIAEVLRKI